MTTSHTSTLFVGGYTEGAGGSGRGIRRLNRDADGRLSGEAVTPAVAPSFLAAHPRLPVLYAVGELPEGLLRAYSVTPDGTLDLLAELPTGGREPCHVAVRPDGSAVAVANYGDGVASWWALDAAGLPAGERRTAGNTGSGPDRDRQEGPHAHLSAFPAEGELWVTDLGTDEIRRYRDGLDPDPAGPIRIQPGTGPRHLAYSGAGSGDRWYLAGELGNGSVTVLVPDGSGGLREASRVPASASRGHNQPSHVDVATDGRFVYVANRGPDTLATFAVDGDRLIPEAEIPVGGAWPRHFVLVDDHLYVANQNSDTITTFALPGGTGIPTPTADPFPTPSPSCLTPWPHHRV
jgi:6-phosphogluconolactonase (cycloisomerase 2 family)